MDELPYVFAVTGAVALLLGALAIGAPHPLWLRVAAVASAALFLPAAYLTQAALLSRAKPASLEWAARAAPEATVLGASLVEGEAIFIWLQLAGRSEPRSYRLPWSRQLAEQLAAAQREAGERGGHARMRRPFGEPGEGEDEPTFYAPPQEPLPEKAAADDGPMIFRPARPAD